MTVEEVIWKRIEAKVDALVTRRLLAFHDALVERKQLSPSTAPSDPVETNVDSTTHCTAGRTA